MHSISPNLNLMIKSCEKVSMVLKRDFGELENLQVSLKGPNNFVTNSDRKVEKILIEELSKSKKKYSFLTEESGFIKNDDTQNFWIIDPIDGTTNFLHGVPHFCVSLGLILDNEIIAGVIYDPIKDEIYYAEKNNGSFLNNKSIRVSKKKNLNECLFGTNLKDRLPKEFITRNSGSAALDMAYVSAGRYDGCIEKNVNLWDIAAGIVLVREAGGIVEDIDLKKIEKITIKASNEIISQEMNKKLDMF